MGVTLSECQRLRPSRQFTHQIRGKWRWRIKSAPILWSVSIRQQDPSHAPSQHQTRSGKAKTQSKGKAQSTTHNYFCSAFSRNHKTGWILFLCRPQRWKVIPHLPPCMVSSVNIPPAVCKPVQNWKWRKYTLLVPYRCFLVSVDIHFQSRIFRLKWTYPLPVHILQLLGRYYCNYICDNLYFLTER